MRFCHPASYTQLNLRYLLNIYCGINTWTCLFRFHLQCIDFLLLVQSAIKDLDSESCGFSGFGLGLATSRLGLDLNLAVAGLDTSLSLGIYQFIVTFGTNWICILRNTAQNR